MGLEETHLGKGAKIMLHGWWRMRQMVRNRLGDTEVKSTKPTDIGIN